MMKLSDFIDYDITKYSDLIDDEKIEIVRIITLLKNMDYVKNSLKKERRCSYDDSRS